MKIAAPVFVEHTYTQNLLGSMEAVFPLLCPVREAEWIEGWDPEVVFTSSGVAEQDCVFITGTGADRAVWVIAEYAPTRGIIELVKTTPELTVAHVRILVKPEGRDRCRAIITYRLTALEAQGEAAVGTFTVERYGEFMRVWEKRLNHYLTTGKMLLGESEFAFRMEGIRTKQSGNEN